MAPPLSFRLQLPVPLLPTLLLPRTALSLTLSNKRNTYAHLLIKCLPALNFATGSRAAVAGPACPVYNARAVSHGFSLRARILFPGPRVLESN